jgi:SAM-dependent methyltransferase
MLKLYSELAQWWPLLSPVEDYAEEAAFFGQMFSSAGLPAAASLLELGCGGGSNAFYLKKSFSQVTLTDLSPQMLAVSRLLNPDCEHLQGDMRSIRVGRMFDAVFIHDAVDYMLTPLDLAQAIETAAIHCRPGGLAMLVPDHVRETFAPDTDHDGGDGEGRALRFLEWTYDPDEDDTTYLTEYVYVLREDGQPLRVEHEQHTCGIFPRADWLRLLREAGFQPEVIRDSYGRDIFLARKPAG